MAGCPTQVLVSLGAGAESFRRPFFAKYLPGVVIKHNKDLERNTLELLLRFNDSKQTRIISLHRREVRLPGSSKSLVADVHFQAAILKIADASGDIDECLSVFICSSSPGLGPGSPRAPLSRELP